MPCTAGLLLAADCSRTAGPPGQPMLLGQVAANPPRCEPPTQSITRAHLAANRCLMST